MRVVRAYRQERAETARFRRLSDDYLERNLRLARVQGLFFPLLTLLGGLSALDGAVRRRPAGHGGACRVGEFVAFGVYLRCWSGR